MAPNHLQDGASVPVLASTCTYDDTRDSGSRSPASAPSSPDTSFSTDSPTTYSSLAAELSFTPLSLSGSEFLCLANPSSSVPGKVVDHDLDVGNEDHGRRDTDTDTDTDSHSYSYSESHTKPAPESVQIQAPPAPPAPPTEEHEALHSATPSEMAATQSTQASTVDASQGGDDGQVSPKCPEANSESRNIDGRIKGSLNEAASDAQTQASANATGDNPHRRQASHSRTPSQSVGQNGPDQDTKDRPSPLRSSSHASRQAQGADLSLSDTPEVDSHTNAIHSNRTSTSIIRAKFLNHEESLPQPTQIKPEAQENSQPQATDQQPLAPEIVRTTTSTGDLPLCHPVPDLNVRSGAYLGNIAQLEDIAERLSMTSSIDHAIREEHRELKRSDSRRSSILAASYKALSPEDDFTASQDVLSALPKASSIIDTNTTARLGGYSPCGYVMSPAHSLSSSRLRSNSKASAGTGPLSVSGGSDRMVSPEEGFPVLSRHGPGKASVRSAHSNKPALPEILENELPVTLSQDALDEADRRIASGEIHEDEDTLRIHAHQRIDMDFSSGLGLDMDLTPNAETWPQNSVLGYNQYEVSPMSFDNQQTPQQYMPNPIDHAQYDVPQQQPPQDRERPTTSGSGGTFEQAQMAFGDFDGVHCDPDKLSLLQELPENENPLPEDKRMSRAPRPAMPRPQSYFDTTTGQQMLYYPARVPAMLNLPPKLSRKPKAAERNVRRSQVLSAMPEAARESRIWLPDPLEGTSGSPFIETTEEHNDASPLDGPPSDRPESRILSMMLPQDSTPSPIAPEDEPLTMEYHRPARISDKRKSKMSNLNDIPAPLRASAFFDLPSTTPQIEIKNGSAMDTLDSILNASAAAPVSAFTDHAFAGKLGSEVYGLEKKSKKKPADKAHLRASSTDALQEKEKKRGSFLSLMGHMKKNSMSSGHRTVIAAEGSADERRPLSSRMDDDMLSPSFSDPAAGALAPDKDERVSSDEEEDDQEEENLEFNGAPTTLLAELQLRKQQQKLRTRPVQQAFPNGMHSTLLELDTVAEVERKQRKGKRINLAWEDPSANPHLGEQDDDEDVPLGMLYAARAAGNNDISMVAAEINRPLGLMERKQMEDNEPLSRRRDRLQGRDAGPSVYLGNGLNNNSAMRQSMMTLTPTVAGLNRTGALGGPVQSATVVPDGPEEEEVEGETLADRMRRLKAREEAASPLPLARPVSRAFSAELLSQFGDLEEDKTKQEASKAKSATATGPPAEEEETLGQRRKRLQAEREAREREMGGLAVNGAALQALTGSDRLSRRVSMADILGAHPLEKARGAVDPREQERLRREEIAAQQVREKQERVRMMRESQMQLQQPDPTMMASGNARAGGYMGGRFNDGTGGGGVGQPAAAAGTGMMYGARQSMPMSGYGYGGGMAMPSQPQQQQQPQMYPQQMMGGYMGAPAGYPAMNMGMGMNMNMNSMYGGMGLMQPTQGQLDMVERWRQGVQP